MYPYQNPQVFNILLLEAVVVDQKDTNVAVEVEVPVDIWHLQLQLLLDLLIQSLLEVVEAEVEVDHNLVLVE
jgi:hypothetical protein